MRAIRRVRANVGLLAGASALCWALSANAETASDLSQLSIEDLGNVQVTSVSKRAEAVNQAPSSIFVITRDDILRAGVVSIPEALRLAPNLEVAQTSASRYVVTARGQNGVPAAQNFSNKLLVLIDGRTVYTPLFSGVYWDMQDYPLIDIERIEVISGPGATLWGANAVNGVINIITRGAAESQGGILAVGGGGREQRVGLRYGGKLSDKISYRLYAKLLHFEDTFTSAGAKANDHWSKSQAGFRVDWTPSARDALTFQGDIYDGDQALAGAPAYPIRGRNLVGRWSRSLSADSALQVQAYYDRAARGAAPDGSGFRVDTYDADFQHSFQLWSRHEVVWGGGYRSFDYGITTAGPLKWAPASRTLNLYNLFVQDTVALSAKLRLILGAKVEDDPYVDAEVLPNVRLAFTPTGKLTLWAAASRAIRAPTPFDRDVQEFLGPTLFLTGGPQFQSEKLTAYELGAKMQPSADASLSVSAFYNDYDDLRSIEPAPAGFLPLRWGNMIEGRTYGAELWGDYQLAAWWRLSGSVSYLQERFRFKPGASGIFGLAQVGNDPKYQASLRSSMTLGSAVTFDNWLRYVSALPNPRLPSYAELNSSLSLAISPHVQLSLTGRNLLHDRHREYTDGGEIPRSLFADLQWRF